MAITTNEDSVDNAMSNVANAHRAAAQSDMRTMATAGQISSDVVKSLSEIDHTLAVNEYYKNKSNANSIITKASINSLNAKAQYSETNSLEKLNDIHEGYHNVLDGVSKGMAKNNLPKAMQESVNDKLEYYRNENQHAYNKRVGNISSDMQYNNFMQSVGAVSLSSGKTPPNVGSMVAVAHTLLDSPYLTASQHAKVTNSLMNISQIDGKEDNVGLDNDSDDHTNVTYSRNASTKGTDNMIKSLFLDHNRALSAANVNLAIINPTKFAEMRANFKEMNDLYGSLGNTHNLMGDLNQLKATGGIGGSVAKQLLPLLNKGQGEIVVRGLSNSTNEAYEQYNQADDEHKPVAWDNYQQHLQAFAHNAGVPMSKIGSLPQNFINTLTDINKDYEDPNYIYTLSSTLDKFNGVNGDNPIYGVGHLSNMARMYKFGDSSNPSFPSFMANMNANRQKDIGKEYGAIGADKSDVSDYLLDKNDVLGQISTITQVPLNELQQMVSTDLKEGVVSGNDFDDVTDKVDKLLDGYINTDKYNIGDNFMLPHGTLSNLGIDKKDSETVVTHAVNVALNSYIKDKTDKPEGIPDGAWETNREDQIGSPSDYTLIFSNGNYYAKNNNNDTLVPVNASMLERADQHIKEGRQALEAGGIFGRYADARRMGVLL